MALDIRQLSHIVVRVQDMDASLSFYRDALGLSQLFELELGGGIGRSVGLGTPGRVSLELLQLKDGDGNPQAVDASADTAMMAFTVADINAARESLAEAGINAPEPMEIEGLKIVFITDPNGRQVEIAELPGAVDSVADMHGA